MSRLIVKNGYIKGGSVKSSSHLSHLVKYVATRDGVEKIRFKNGDVSATHSQQDLIKNLIRDFPSSKNSYEYEDYKANPTIANASEFITESLDRHFISASDNEKYLDYIANRPRVEVISTHGLFNGGDEKIVLSHVADEISSHTGNVWTPILSLRREDAATTEFETAAAWKALISSKVFELAKSFSIHPDNFRWYAAFHDEGHHPHVHLICYSTNPNEGYLTTKGIEKMKSVLTNEIFKQELTPLYAEKTMRRNELKVKAREAFRELKSKVGISSYDNPKLESLIAELSKKLKTVTGKKQYGYLRPPLKKLIDEIVDELATEPSVKHAYDLWCELQSELHSFYSEDMPELLPLSKQKEFKSIKNMIIGEVAKLDFEHMQSRRALQSCVSRLLHALSKVFEDHIPHDSTTGHMQTDRKQLCKIREKKLALGQKIGAQEQENVGQRFAK